MPRGIPGSGKAALKKAQAVRDPVLPGVPPAPVKKGRWGKKAEAVTGGSTNVAGSERSYSDLEKFSAAQTYLANLLSFLRVGDPYPMSTVPELFQREILATFEVLGELRTRIFGSALVPDASQPVAPPERKASDERIRQHMPPPTLTHVGPPMGTPIAGSNQQPQPVQQQPFVPGTPSN